MEQLELHIQDVGALPDLELKLKDSKSRELGRLVLSLMTLLWSALPVLTVRLTVDLSAVEKEKTQEMELRFPGEEGRLIKVR